MKNVFRIQFRTTDDKKLSELLQRLRLDTGCCGPRRLKDGVVLVDGFASQEQVTELEQAGIKLEEREDITEHLKARMAEVGTGDRFAGGRIAPRGLGIKK